MLKNVFVKTVRDYRWSILWWGGGLAFLMAATSGTYPSLFNGPNKAKQMADLQSLISSFSFLTGKVSEATTFGGFMYVKAIVYGVVLMSFFAILAGTMLIRGEEERGSLDVALSTPYTRLNILLQKAAGLAVVEAIMGTVGCLGLLAGVASAKIDVSIGAVILTFVDFVLLALVYGSLALLLSQFMTRKESAAWTGGILAATYAMFTVGDSVDSLNWLRPFSPIYYFNLSKPLIASVGTNWAAMLMLVALTALFTFGAIYFYLRRDQNDFSHFFGFYQSKAKLNTQTASSIKSRSFWLKNDFFFGLGATLPAAVIWGVGMSCYIVLIMSIFQNIRDSTQDWLSSADIFKQLGFAISPTNESLLNIFIIFFLVILFAAYAVSQVWNWAGEENEGRLELTFSTPEPRWRLALVRYAVSASCSLVTIIITFATFIVSAALFNVKVDFSKSFGAFLGLWVVCLMITAFGFVLTALKANNATAILGGLVIVSYLANILADIFKLPDWVLSFSIFHQYGQPLVEGLKWTPQFLMLGLIIVFLAVTVFRFSQRDITS